jgi:type I restriction enzyme M protein
MLHQIGISFSGTSNSNPSISDDQKRQLEIQLWRIANFLRGKISADDYRDYILGFIF